MGRNSRSPSQVRLSRLMRGRLWTKRRFTMSNYPPEWSHRQRLGPPISLSLRRASVSLVHTWDELPSWILAKRKYDDVGFYTTLGKEWLCCPTIREQGWGVSALAELQGVSKRATSLFPPIAAEGWGGCFGCIGLSRFHLDPRLTAIRWAYGNLRHETKLHLQPKCLPQRLGSSPLVGISYTTSISTTTYSSLLGVGVWQMRSLRPPLSSLRYHATTFLSLFLLRPNERKEAPGPSAGTPETVFLLVSHMPSLHHNTASAGVAAN